MIVEGLLSGFHQVGLGRHLPALDADAGQGEVMGLEVPGWSSPSTLVRGLLEQRMGLGACHHHPQRAHDDRTPSCD